MTATRRRVVGLGGGLLAALSLPPLRARAEDAVIEIAMHSSGNGARVWFDPLGVRIEPGQTVRWINRDKGNTHTSTAYHPANLGRPRRIPEAAKSWNSGYLLPGGSYSVALSEPGVYDYFCIPHEAAGMAGRIVVGEPGLPPWIGGDESQRLRPAVRAALPPVEEILEKRVVRPEGL